MTGISRSIKFAIRIYRIHHVMRHRGLLIRRRFGSADIHLPIDLHGVRANDFSAKALGQINGKTGFAYARGAADDNDFDSIG